LPEVSLVAIIDADKEGFLRSARSLTQTVGRAARHLNGKAIMYADNVTKSMQKTIDETQYRREKQLAYNAKNKITPQALNKSLETVFDYEQTTQPLTQAAEPDLEYLTKDQLKTKIRETRKSMETAAKALDFMEAARLRDLIQQFQKHLVNTK